MEGKCLCGKIHFKFTPTDGVAMNCYCSMCRRAHGADYATQVMSSKDTLEFISGQADLKEYCSSELGIRAFCSNCGSRLMNYAKTGSKYMSVSLSVVVGDHQICPSINIQTASKAAWVKPNPDLPSYEEFPSDIQKYL